MTDRRRFDLHKICCCRHNSPLISEWCPCTLHGSQRCWENYGEQGGTADARKSTFTCVVGINPGRFVFCGSGSRPDGGARHDCYGPTRAHDSAAGGSSARTGHDRSECADQAARGHDRSQCAHPANSCGAGASGMGAAVASSAMDAASGNNWRACARVWIWPHGRACAQLLLRRRWRRIRRRIRRRTRRTGTGRRPWRARARRTRSWTAATT